MKVPEKTRLTDWLANTKYDPHTFRKTFPQVVTFLGFDPTDRRAAFTQSLFDWIYGRPTCESPICDNVPTFRSMYRGYDRFCCKKCTYSDEQIKEARTQRTDVEKQSMYAKAAATRAGKSLEDIETERHRRIEAHARRSNENETERCRRITDALSKRTAEEWAVINSKKFSTRLDERIELMLNKVGNLATPAFDLLTYRGRGPDQIYKWVCNTCSAVFEDSIEDVSPLRPPKPRCPICFPLKEMSSYEEMDFASFVGSLVPIERNIRIIGKKEADVFVRNANVIFEYNGCYWHSEYYVGKKYHFDKKAAAEELNYSLFHIMDFEWRTRRLAVENRIKAILGVSKRYGARTCQCIKLDHKTAAKFMEQYHTQGSVRHKIAYGLIHPTQGLVAAMTFGSERYSKNTNSYELLRFASIGVIVGGGSKMLNAFIEEFDPQRIISFADKRWTRRTSSVYINLGFLLDGSPSPSYFYANKKGDILNRIAAQKHKLVASGADPALTEGEIMAERGWYKVWDCGHQKFVWTKKVDKVHV